MLIKLNNKARASIHVICAIYSTRNLTLFNIKVPFPPPLHFLSSSVSFKVPHRGLVAVVGAVGSGKSSLVNSILGEMFRKSGHIRYKVPSNNSNGALITVNWHLKGAFHSIGPRPGMTVDVAGRQTLQNQPILFDL